MQVLIHHHLSPHAHSCLVSHVSVLRLTWWHWSAMAHTLPVPRGAEPETWASVPGSPSLSHLGHSGSAQCCDCLPADVDQTVLFADVFLAALGYFTKVIQIYILLNTILLSMICRVKAFSSSPKSSYLAVTTTPNFSLLFPSISISTGTKFYVRVWCNCWSLKDTVFFFPHLALFFLS